MEKYINELKVTLIKIHKDLFDLNESNFETTFKNINNRMLFLKNFKEKAGKEMGDEALKEIEFNLKPETKLIFDFFDSIIEKRTSESNNLLAEIKIAENKKKIFNYRNYDEY